MNFYYLYDESGNYEVICTRCFTSMGIANGLNAARRIQAIHVCGRTAQVIPIGRDGRRPSKSIMSPVERLFGPSGKLRNLNTSILFLAVVFLLYAVPTILEVAATKHLNPWLAVVLPGDVVGCACLITVFKMPRTGLILYMVLTICEAALYGLHMVAARELIWVVDLVPTVTAACLIMLVRIPNGLHHLRSLRHKF